MTLGELIKILEATGYPVAYSHFIATPRQVSASATLYLYSCGWISKFNG